ncbi:hypothetical protein LAZ67_7002969 [Cordylochernes scorpioides]|uniref:Uncharacterized protein n=1 Tax=Cordylochernes scorpioides TaxID=51811 RepID=A0ABY6KS65_9ARAC|nr:hypothetical protein LAZ67_7002969 [Cordylochernes scorpioides]
MRLVILSTATPWADSICFLMALSEDPFLSFSSLIEMRIKSEILGRGWLAATSFDSTLTSDMDYKNNITRLRMKHYKEMTIHPDGTRTYRTCNNGPGVKLSPTQIFSFSAMARALQKIDMDPEQQIYTPKIESIATAAIEICMETSEAIHWPRQQQQKIDMDPEQQLYTPKIENDCCDRDAWRHLRLFIGHDNNNRKLKWTQNSSFTYPR